MTQKRVFPIYSSTASHHTIITLAIRSYSSILLFGPAEPFFHPGSQLNTLSRADAVKTGPSSGRRRLGLYSVEHGSRLMKSGGIAFSSHVGTVLGS